MNEQLITIPSGQTNIDNVNIGTEHTGISHILLIGNVSGLTLRIYKWSELGNGYFPLFLSTDDVDSTLKCIANKCIFFNKYILTGDRFKFELDSAAPEDIKIILFKSNRL